MKASSGASSLNPSEEALLWEKIKSGDEDSRERIILAYRPMVFWLAKKFRVSSSSFPDLLQEGVVGLITAVDNFEPERSNKFITYAYYKVKGRMVNFLQRSEAKAPVPVEDEALEWLASDFEAWVDNVEWHISLDEGLLRLPERERDIVRSMIVEGRDAAEVAGSHGVGISHIYRLRRKAISQLRRLFS